MKKIISLVLTVCILCMGIYIPSYATGSATLTVTASGCTVGEKVNVAINLSEYSLACGGSFEIKYDNTRLSLVSAVKGSAFSNISTTINTKFTDSSVKVVWFGTKAPAGGEIINMVFDTIKEGTASIELKNVMLSDLEADSIPCIINNTSIEISGGTITMEMADNPSAVIIRSPDETEVNVIFASYKAEKLLVTDIVPVSLKKGINNAYASEMFSYEEADVVKIFLWENVGTIKPICEPLKINLITNINGIK